MSWDSIDNTNGKQAEEMQAKAREEQLALAKAFHDVFTSKSGQKVLEHLNGRFVYNNDTPFGSPNIEYEAAFHNGEAGAIKYINTMISRARIL